MAPSRRSATTPTKPATTICNFAKVTKAQHVKPSKQVPSVKLQALSNAISEKSRRYILSPLKRKRQDDDEEEDTIKSKGEAAWWTSTLTILPTPPSTPTAASTNVPIHKRARHVSSTAINDSMQKLQEIFKYFLRAFSVHLAHNGRGSPTELHTLLPTITRLHKKRTISKEDLQRAFAVFEDSSDAQGDSPALLKQSNSPFQLTVSRLATASRHLVEYCSPLPYNEGDLLQDFADRAEIVLDRGRNDAENFIHAPLEHWPLLAFEKGTQTAKRQQKASAVRQHVLSGAPQRQEQKSETRGVTVTDFKKVSPMDSSIEKEERDESPGATSSTKSRTLSLFDRVRAKQAIASLNTVPTSAELLRHHAIGRIGDVVEILRMKQNQRTSLASTSTNKVSFSMAQVVTLIKSSLSVPMADEEIRLCISILAEEVNDGWLRILEIGSLQSVIVQGQGMRGEELRGMLMNKP